MAPQSSFQATGTAMGNMLRETRTAWPGLSTYARFEQGVTLMFFGLLDPAEHGVFQAIFGMIFTVLIALEFNHSILGVLERKESIVQVKTVVLIALLALARKFIILDATKTEPMTIIGLAAAILALGPGAGRRVLVRARPGPQRGGSGRTSN